VNGEINIIEDTVHSGQEIHVELRSPEDAPLFQQIRIFKDPPQSDVANNNWPLANMCGSVSILDEQSSVGFGEPFSVTVDTLDWDSGNYYFVTCGQGSEFQWIHDNIQVMPMDETPLIIIRNDMANNNRLFAIYSENGSFIADASNEGPTPTLSMNTIYILAVNLNMLHIFKNTIHADFYDTSGVQLEKSDILRIKIVRDKQFSDTLKVQGICDGEPIDLTSFPEGIALIHFRTPEHQKYYEYDGQLHFHFSGNVGRDPTCDFEDFGIQTHLDDSPAHPAIPDFQSYNLQKYPSQPWRNDYPFDTFHVRFVRFGNIGFTTDEELQQLGEQFEQQFAIATRGYFKVVVDGFHYFPFVQQINEQEVRNWYQSIPKTPSKEVLDITDPDQLYLAALLYYYENNNIEAHMRSIYPMLSNNEDYTIYLHDGPFPIGQAMGDEGNRVLVTYLYPGSAFFQGSGDDRTYHVDLEAPYFFCGNTIGEYLDWLRGYSESQVTLVALTHVMIHECGHTLWKKKSGVSTGDYQTYKRPFASDAVYHDDSVCFFNRFSYMSYLRNRRSFDGMSYGDAYLEEILAAHAQPEAWVESVSHPAHEDPHGGGQTINAHPGEQIVFNLHGSAGSGLRMLWYFNESSPTPLAYNTPEKSGVFYYDPDGPRVKRDRREVTITLNERGTYIYRHRSRSRLYPIVWQSHQSVLGTFTINVRG
jgi:hypothetical protein